MRRKAAVLVLLCWLPVLASAGEPAPARISFAAMGDVPYRPEERVKLAADLLRLPNDLAFVVHVGDIKPGTPFCREGEYADIARILRGSKVPVFILPGDNEWNDCSRPERAWSFWMTHFHRFESRWPAFSEVERQPEVPANFAFVRSGVLFIGIHLVGGRVHDPVEWRDRHAKDLAWIQTRLERLKNETSAAVVFGHGQPADSSGDFFPEFSRMAGVYGHPVLYLHGDGHRWVHDRPFPAENVERFQVDMGGVAAPVIVRVAVGEVAVFEFDQR